MPSMALPSRYWYEEQRALMSGEMVPGFKVFIVESQREGEA